MTIDKIIHLISAFFSFQPYKLYHTDRQLFAYTKLPVRHSPQAPLLGRVAKIASLNLSPSKSLYGGYVSLIFCTNWVTWSSATRDTVHPPHPAPTAIRPLVIVHWLSLFWGGGPRTHQLIDYHTPRLLYTTL